jgi:hypothetical protein
LYTLNNGTCLTLMHSGFAPYRRSDGYMTGWSKVVNEPKSMIEIGPSWQKATAGDASEIVLRFALFLLISLGHIYALGSQICFRWICFALPSRPTSRSADVKERIAALGSKHLGDDSFNGRVFVDVCRLLDWLG